MKNGVQFGAIQEVLSDCVEGFMNIVNGESYKSAYMMGNKAGEVIYVRMTIDLITKEEFEADDGEEVTPGHRKEELS